MKKLLFFDFDGVETTNNAVLTDDDLRLAAEPVEYASKLNRDVTTSRDEHALGLVVERKEPIRGDAVLGTGYVRYDRSSAGRNNDAFRFVGIVSNCDGMCVVQAGLADDGFNAAIVQVGPVNTIESLHVRVAPLLQRCPAMAVHSDIETVITGMLEMMRLARRVPHHLFGNATHIDAGASQWSVLDNGRFGAVLGRAPCVGNATTTATDDDEIELRCVKILHAHVQPTP